MWHSNSNYSLLLIHFLSLQFSDLESLDSGGCGYSCVQESWKCTCLWMQSVINHLRAPEIICYTAKSSKGQFSLLSGVFEVSWNIHQVTPWAWVSAAGFCTVCTGQCHPEPLCSPAPSAGHRNAFFCHGAALKWLHWHYSPVLCCVQARGREWIRSCGRATPQCPAAHLGSEHSTDNKLQRK